jgi:hypothetical protein
MPRDDYLRIPPEKDSSIHLPLHNRDKNLQYGPTVLRLHRMVGWGLVALWLAMCVALAILYRYSEKHQGLFTIRPAQNVRDSVVLFLWSSGPTLFTTIVAGAILAPLALALFIVAPYTELERGGAKAEHSILANYAILGMFERFQLARRNRKWGLLALTIATFLAGLLDTAASGLIEPRNILVGIFLLCYLL